MSDHQLVTIETKYLPQSIKAIDDRTVTGIFAVHGNVDDGGDRSHMGAFADAVAGRNRVKHLWNHGGGWFDRGQTPPIATVKNIREISRDELPGVILAFAPDATGGAEVTRTYLNTDRANEILAGLIGGAIDEMSYAFEVTKATYTETDELFIREIHGMKLFDTSDVNWGLNPATLAKKSALVSLPFADHFQAVLATVEEFSQRAEDLKRLRATDGRSLSTINFDRLKTLYSQLEPLTVDLAALFDRSDEAKQHSHDVRAEFYRLKAQAIELGVF